MDQTPRGAWIGVPGIIRDRRPWHPICIKPMVQGGAMHDKQAITLQFGRSLLLMQILQGKYCVMCLANSVMFEYLFHDIYKCMQYIFERNCLFWFPFQIPACTVVIIPMPTSLKWCWCNCWCSRKKETQLGVARGQHPHRRAPITKQTSI